MSPPQEMRVKLLPRIAEYRAKEWINPKEEAEMNQLLSSPTFGDTTNQVALQVSKSLDEAREQHESKVASVSSKALEQAKERHKKNEFKAAIVSTKEESKPPPVSSRSRSLFRKSTKAPAGLTLERKLSFRRKSRLELTPEKEEMETRDAKEEVSDDTSIDSRDLSNIQSLFGGKKSDKGEKRECQGEKETIPETKGKSEVSRKEETPPPPPVDKKNESEGEREEKTPPVDKKEEIDEVKEEKKTSSGERIQSMFKNDGRTSLKEEKKTTAVESKSDRFAKMRSRLARNKSANKLVSVQQGKADESSLWTKHTKDTNEVVQLPQENDDTLSLVSKDTTSATIGLVKAHQEKIETSSLAAKHIRSKSEVVEWPQENDNTSSLASQENKSVSKVVKVQEEKIKTSSLAAKHAGIKSEVVEWPQENDDTSSLASKELQEKIETSSLFTKHPGSRSVNGAVTMQNDDNSSLTTEDSKSLTSGLFRGQKEKLETSSLVAKHARSKSVNGAVSVQNDDNSRLASHDSKGVSGLVKVQQAKIEMSSLAAKLTKRNKAVDVQQEDASPSKMYVQQPVWSVPQENTMKDRLNDANRGEEQQIFEPRQMSIGSKEEIKDLFVEVAFFARLGFVQPPSCLQCVYHEGINMGTPDLHCKRFVPWRKNANTPIHPYHLDDNIVLVRCQAARLLVQGQEVEKYQWDKVRRQLVTK
jgi:hypothetical protein